MLVWKGMRVSPFISSETGQLGKREEVSPYDNPTNGESSLTNGNGNGIVHTLMRRRLRQELVNDEALMCSREGEGKFESNTWAMCM
jgi:hypothetical protein